MTLIYDSENVNLSSFLGYHFKKPLMGTSLVVQWLGICLPMQGTRVQALVREDPTCHGAPKPMRHPKNPVSPSTRVERDETVLLLDEH